MPWLTASKEAKGSTAPTNGAVAAGAATAGEIGSKPAGGSSPLVARPAENVPGGLVAPANGSASANGGASRDAAGTARVSGDGATPGGLTHRLPDTRGANDGGASRRRAPSVSAAAGAGVAGVAASSSAAAHANGSSFGDPNVRVEVASSVASDEEGWFARVFDMPSLRERRLQIVAGAVVAVGLIGMVLFMGRTDASDFSLEGGGSARADAAAEPGGSDGLSDPDVPIQTEQFDGDAPFGEIRPVPTTTLPGLPQVRRSTTSQRRTSGTVSRGGVNRRPSSTSRTPTRQSTARSTAPTPTPTASAAPAPAAPAPPPPPALPAAGPRNYLGGGSLPLFEGAKIDIPGVSVPTGIPVVPTGVSEITHVTANCWESKVGLSGIQAFRSQFCWGGDQRLSLNRQHLDITLTGPATLSCSGADLVVPGDVNGVQRPVTCQLSSDVFSMLVPGMNLAGNVTVMDLNANNGTAWHVRLALTGANGARWDQDMWIASSGANKGSVLRQKTLIRNVLLTNLDAEWYLTG